MATQQWKTLSVKVTEEEENALKILCANRKQKKHAILRELLLAEIDPIIKTDRIPQGEGIPLIGEHIFKYNTEKDNFTWQINLGAHGVHALAENVTYSFLENLKSALEIAFEERQGTEEKISNKMTRVPKSIMKYKVKN